MTRIPRFRRAVASLLPLLLVAGIPAAGLIIIPPASEPTQLLNVAENAVIAVETAATVVETANTVLELKDQIEQDLDKAMGKIAALTEAFEDLSSDPMSLLENAQGLSWAGDFSGGARQLLNAAAEMQDDTGNSLLTHVRAELAAADTVSRTRYVRTYDAHPDASEIWTERREQADRQLVADFLVPRQRRAGSRARRQDLRVRRAQPPTDRTLGHRARPGGTRHAPQRDRSGHRRRPAHGPSRWAHHARHLGTREEPPRAARGGGSRRTRPEQARRARQQPHSRTRQRLDPGSRPQLGDSPMLPARTTCPRREAWPAFSRRVSRRVYPRRTALAHIAGRVRATCALGRKSCAGSGSGATRRRRRLLLSGLTVFFLAALPAAAQPIPENQLTDLPLFVDQAIANFLTGSTASQRIWQSGDLMARNIAAILVVWTGLRIAFSGTFNAWELIKFIFILGWPLFFINFYYTNIPGVGLTFPRLIAEGGDWISTQFGAGILATAMSTLMELGQQQYEALGTEADRPGLWDTLRSGGRVVIHGLLTTGIITAFVLGMIVVVALALAQVVFAKIAIAILIAIGPVFIPFMIVPKMDFLFWGWFKALIQYSLYNAIAMIMLNIWCTVINRYATSMGNLDVSFQSLALLTGTWMVPVAAVLVCAIVSIMKVGDIAGMIVGAGSDGGGIIGGAFMAGRIVAAPARVAAAPLKGGMPT